MLFGHSKSLSQLTLCFGYKVSRSNANKALCVFLRCTENIMYDHATLMHMHICSFVAKPWFKIIKKCPYPEHELHILPYIARQTSVCTLTLAYKCASFTCKVVHYPILNQFIYCSQNNHPTLIHAHASINSSYVWSYMTPTIDIYKSKHKEKTKIPYVLALQNA